MSEDLREAAERMRAYLKGKEDEKKKSILIERIRSHLREFAPNTNERLAFSLLREALAVLESRR